MKSNIQHDAFKEIWMSFNANLGALREFSLRIAPLADELDQNKLAEIFKKSADLFESDPEEVRQEVLDIISYSDELDLEPDLRGNQSAHKYLEFAKSDEFKSLLQKWVRGNPAKLRILSEISQLTFGEPPENGILLRRSALIIIISLYETILSSLLRLYYDLSAEENQDEENNVSKKLRRLVYSGNLKERLEHIESLDVNLESMSGNKEKLVEIAERRNLFVHHNGVISQRYLEKTGKSNEKALIGRQYRVTNSYLLEAIDTLYFCGFILIQQCWRKWTKGHHRQADKHYVNALFNLLNQERYNLTIQLSQIPRHFGLQKHEAQMVAINHAIALRDLGRQEEAFRVVSGFEAAPASKSVEIAICILKQDYDRAFVLITQTKDKKKLTNLYSASPLFRPLQQDPRFAKFTGTTAKTSGVNLPLVADEAKSAAMVEFKKNSRGDVK